MQTLKNKIVKGLRDYMNCHVVPTDTADRKPDYPYLSYKVTSPLENSRGFSLADRTVPSGTPGFVSDVEVTRKEQAQFSLSVSAYSDDEDEACSLALKAADWFRFHGYEYLKDCNIVVIEVSNIGDRTALIVDDYERRYGFDVRCRAAKAVSKVIGAIEQHNFQSKINP